PRREATAKLGLGLGGAAVASRDSAHEVAVGERSDHRASTIPRGARTGGASAPEQQGERQRDHAPSASAKPRSKAAPFPRKELPCMRASVAGSVRASFSRSARVFFSIATLPAGVALRNASD